MDNFYEILEVIFSASLSEILLAYENKISKFNDIDKLSNKQIVEIKLLKKALYVLRNPVLRKKYNELLMTNNKTSSTKKDPQPLNDDSNDNLDSLFSVDKYWMKKITIPNKDKTDRKEDSIREKGKGKTENNALGDRVFSLSHMMMRPGYSQDFEIKIRKQEQGRPVKEADTVT